MFQPMVLSTSEHQFSFREGRLKNGSVRLHYVESGWDSPTDLTPVVYVHSGFGTSEVFIPEMKALSPRRCVSCSLRGRGNSDAPEAGYFFEQNVSDIDAVVNHLGFDRICVMGWSLGVTYSIAYAAQHPELVAGLVLLDYPARHPKFSAGWAERWSSEPSVKDDPNRMRGMRGLERDSTEILLWDKLDAIRSPILLIGGGAEEALLKPEHVEKYRQHCQNLEVAIFPDSGHMVWQPDYDRFINRVNKFLDYIDDQRSR
ncbi:alpha/beta hydrolase [Candidatus Bathyarchaeota archaeon]|nr:MAG: alpha/beta hydrolase [Candidatus Bathyarchaeota archaeon]